MGCGGSKPKDGGDSGPGDNGSAKGGKDKSKDVDKKQAQSDNQEYQEKLVWMKNVPLFKSLPFDKHPILAEACEVVKYKAGQVIIKQGDRGSEFFIVKKGEASVTVISQEDAENGESKGTAVAVLKKGDYFGENALLRDEPRTATITANADVECLKLTRAKFEELQLMDHLQFASRKAVGAGGGGARNIEIHAPDPKTEQERKLIAESFSRNENLKTMVTLDEARVNAMIDVAWKADVKAGTEVIKEGDLAADYFYVVQEGKFDIHVLDTALGDQQQPGRENTKKVGQVGQGGSFGELALLYLVPRAATVQATEDSKVWVFDRQSFKRVLMKASESKVQEYVKYLGNVPQLNPLLKDEKKALAEALVEMHFGSGEIILQQGEPGNTFYILYEGEVDIIVDGTVVKSEQASKSRGEARVFGEKALLNEEARAATVRVTSETAKALALDRDSFQMLLGPLQDILDAEKNGGDRKGGLKNVKGDLNPQDGTREKILRRDLQRIGLLGCGGFGAVELYEHKVKKDTFAMKGLSKGYIVKTCMQESVMNEKNILMMTNSPFIIRLWETYNGSQTLYFLLEAALGGELYATYNRKGFHGMERHAKFYTAGTVLAFDHMHQRRIIYRDLKPENLLMNDKGNLKVTDMGLAKFVIGKTYTTCGTPDYFAPELIASTGHTNAVDWWTLGILIFELMSGHPPFESAYPMQIYSKVMKGISKVDFSKCQGPLADLIKSLLKKEPSERLPMRPGGLVNIKNHKWFAGFDWPSFTNGSMDPPYKPLVKSAKDLANFSARKEDMPRQIQYEEKDNDGWDKDFATV